MKFEYFQEKTEAQAISSLHAAVERPQWRWRLKANNGKAIASSGEGYHNLEDCLHAIDLLKSTNAQTPVVEAARGLLAEP